MIDFCTNEFNLINVEYYQGCLHLCLNSPENRNALTEEMIGELQALSEFVAKQGMVRAIVLRGGGGDFCSGGDIRGFKAIVQGKYSAASLVEGNRKFGALLESLDSLPQPLITVAEGAVFGGGVGLLCVSDVAIALADVKIALSETRIGVIPAQVAPFLVKKVGQSASRYLTLTANRIDGLQAEKIGLVNEAYQTTDQLNSRLSTLISDILLCAPLANQVTKTLLKKSSDQKVKDILDQAAVHFAEQLLDGEGLEGATAFLEKRSPNWVNQNYDK